MTLVNLPLKKNELNCESVAKRWNELISTASPSKIPKTVYHYTDASGLLNILRSKCILATEKDFLNDRTEIVHGIGIASKILLDIRNKSKSEDTKSLIDLVFEYSRFESPNRYFVFSMSSRKDDLSQWRGYANDGDGFTIGFSTSVLCEMSTLENAQFSFNKVSYALYDFRKSINSALKDFQQCVENGEDEWTVAAYLDSFIEGLSTFQKHSSFKNEREFRILVAQYDEIEQVEVRESRGRLIPFVKVPLCSEGGLLPITEIGIGPAVANPNTGMVIRDLCKWCTIDPEIYLAATPFVRY